MKTYRGSAGIAPRILDLGTRWRSISSNAYRILVGKPEEKRPHGRPRCKWVNNIKMYL
jgi:hypothetical protein